MKLLLALVAAATMVGCSAGDGENVDRAPAPASAAMRSRVAGPDKIDPPDFSKKTAIRMIRKGDEVRIGDSIESALRAFREEKNAYKVAEMPAGWRDPAYSAQGWDNGTTGFGAIVFDDKVVFGLFHEERSDEGRLQEILAVYDRMLNVPATNVVGSRVRYWFWQKDNHRLMISAVQPPTGGLSISIAMGHAPIMDILGMNAKQAEKDRVAAESIFEESRKAMEKK
jgi:hypothetical protein